MINFKFKSFLVLVILLSTSSLCFSQMSDAPDRVEGEGPFEKLIIRGVNLIDGTGSPMMGPVDLVIS